MKGTGIIAGIAAAIVGFQLFVPPIVGLADQGDFPRMIGRFGYRAEQSGLETLYVAPKYVRAAGTRLPDWEQFSSEYAFVLAGIGLNHVVSKDGKLDIQVIGMIHALAFLGAFWRLLYVTRAVSMRVFVWIAMLIVLTDVAYVAFFNSFFAEPASLIFFLLLAAESIAMARADSPCPNTILRWTACAVLFVLAKPINAFPGILLALFLLRFRHRIARAGCVALLAAAIFAIATTPREMRNANTYNLVFLSVLPESRNPAADLQALGLNRRYQDYSHSGAWSAGSPYPELEARGDIGGTVTLPRVLGFYLRRPARLWRHIQVTLPYAMYLRSWYGNYEPSSGYPPATLSRAFSFWSDIHAKILRHIAKLIFFLLPLPALALAFGWRKRNLALEMFALLGLCALAEFLAADFGDGWDTVKHLLMFNLMVDAFLLGGVAAGCSVLIGHRKTVRVPVVSRAWAAN